MLPEKQKLDAVLDRIKAILNEEDIVASIVLITPKANSTINDFVTVQYAHVSTSYSCAKSFRHHCCDAHGHVDGIMIQVSTSDEDTVVVVTRLQQTLAMFHSLYKSAEKTKQMFKMVMTEITETLLKKRSQDKTDLFKNSQN